MPGESRYWDEDAVTGNVTHWLITRNRLPSYNLSFSSVATGQRPRGKSPSDGLLVPVSQRPHLLPLRVVGGMGYPGRGKRGSPQEDGGETSKSSGGAQVAHGGFGRSRCDRFDVGTHEVVLHFSRVRVGIAQPRYTQ